MFNDAPAERKPLVVVGSVNADLVIEVDRLPKPGETIAGSSMRVFPGGKGANQAAAAAKLGYPTFFVGQVGRDAYGGMLRSSLADSGVDTSMLYSVDGPSGLAFIMLQPGGENSIVLVGGANTSEEWSISDEVTAAIQAAGAVLLQCEIPEVVNVIFAKIAASARVPVILDAGGAARPLGSDLLANVSVLSPNETELEALTGLPTRSEKQCVAAAEALVHQGVDKVLVKMGSRGSVLVDIYGNAQRQAAAPVLSVVDTTAAGDCFTGAYAVGLLQGRGDAEAMDWASTAAALCIQRQGAMPSLPTREEVEKERAHRSAGGEKPSSGGDNGGQAARPTGGGSKPGSPGAEKRSSPPRQSFW